MWLYNLKNTCYLVALCKTVHGQRKDVGYGCQKTSERVLRYSQSPIDANAMVQGGRSAGTGKCKLLLTGAGFLEMQGHKWPEHMTLHRRNWTAIKASKSEAWDIVYTAFKSRKFAYIPASDILNLRTLCIHLNAFESQWRMDYASSVQEKYRYSWVSMTRARLHHRVDKTTGLLVGNCLHNCADLLYSSRCFELFWSDFRYVWNWVVKKLWEGYDE